MFRKAFVKNALPGWCHALNHCKAIHIQEHPALEGAESDEHLFQIPTLTCLFGNPITLVRLRCSDSRNLGRNVCYSIGFLARQHKIPA